MFYMVGGAMAALSAVGSLSSLLQSNAGSAKSGVTTGVGPSQFAGALQTPTDGKAPSAPGCQSCAFAPSTMASLIDLQSGQPEPGASRANNLALQSLFKLLDGNGDGQISKTELQDAFGVKQGADATGDKTTLIDALFSKLDNDGNGNISSAEMMAGLKDAPAHPRHPVSPQSDASSIAAGAPSTTVAGTAGR